MLLYYITLLWFVIFLMFSFQFIVVASLFVAASLAAPQAGVCPGTGLPWNADANTVDANVRVICK